MGFIIKFYNGPPSYVKDESDNPNRLKSILKDSCYRIVPTHRLGTGRVRSTLCEPLVKCNLDLCLTIEATQEASRRWRLLVSRLVMTRLHSRQSMTVDQRNGLATRKVANRVMWTSGAWPFKANQYAMACCKLRVIICQHSFTLLTS